MIDTNQVFLIIGVVGVLLLIVTTPFIFQNREARLSRFFRRHNDIRFQVVAQTSRNPSSLPEDLTTVEMVAVLMLISVRETVSDAFAVAQRFSSMGWASKFNDEFFDQLNMTARRFSSGQWNRDGLDLFHLGQRIANAHNFSSWEREFTESIDRLNQKRFQNSLPPRLQ